MIPLAPMVPARYRVATVERETADTLTLGLDPVDRPIAPPDPGQFTMVYGFGTGEIPVSVSGCPDDGGLIHHTIRGVGAVSHALGGAIAGTMVGIRGPFGSGWEVDRAAGGDVVVVAGGIGLAPLRPVVRRILARRDTVGAAAIVIGARTPADLMFRAEVDEWRRRPDLETVVTVDAADRMWDGAVGLVTQPLADLPFDPAATTAFVCGPEVMIRLVAGALVERGLAPARIRVSLERNMHCAIGHCGRCQLGPLLLCADGPVVGWDVAHPLLEVRRW